MERLNKAIKKIRNHNKLNDKEKEIVEEHLREWYNEKKSIAYVEEKLEEWWEELLPILNEAGLI